MALIGRRALLAGLTGLAGVACAPAIVRVTSLMPVRAWRGTGSLTLAEWARLPGVDTPEIAEMLCRANGVLKEMLWRDPWPV